MSEHRRRIDKVLDPSYLADLPEWSLDAPSRRHAECLDIETEVSYLRRVTQARIDILEAELDRRARGGSVGDLIAAVPEILADEGPRASIEKSRLNRRLAPSMDIKWLRGREHLSPTTRSRRCRASTTTSFRSTMRELGRLEQDVSRQRRQLHQVIDRTDAELAAPAQGRPGVSAPGE
jgi:hypothetical protein